MEPKFCPNCGKNFNQDSLVKSFTGLTLHHNKKDEITVPVKGWGIECFNCDWSGEILPDDEQTIFNKLITVVNPHFPDVTPY